jgi:enoyl-CoA hydratase/carnithine racemase
MPFVDVSHEDHVGVLSLGRAKANALNAALVDELAAAVDELATAPGTRALVLASALPRVFCAGFDVAEVFRYEREPMLAFFTRFVALFERLRVLPKPVVCALGGHAFAGGAILALAADFRVMAESASFSVNEVDLGVMLPARMIRALGASAGPELARSMLLGAEVLSASRALAGGLVSEVLPAADVTQAAIRRARLLGEKPAAAFAAHKRALDPVEPGPIAAAEVALTIDAWFGAESSARRQALIDKLQQKSAATP